MNVTAAGLGKVLAQRTKAAINKALTDLTAQFTELLTRVKSLEDRPAPQDGAAGRDGADATPEQVQEAVAAFLKANPPEPGQDGAPASAEMVSAAVAAFLEANPAPAGKDGAAGRDGADATPEQIAAAVIDYMVANPVYDGKDGRNATPEQILEAVHQHIAQHPIRDGRDGRDGKDGKDGSNGMDGKDGVNGRDGLGFDDIECEFDGERTISLKFVKGDYYKTFPIYLKGLPRYLGVFRPGEHKQGDNVTWDGSIWIAVRDTDKKPKDGDDWVLAVKRGNNGRDGEKGKEGAPGKPGRNGKDLTHIAPDGSRY